jgi:Ca2+-binding RTX toxin-like protein
MRRRSLVVIASLVLPAALLVQASPASAITSHVNGGVLTVSGDSGVDIVGVRCVGGGVKVNGVDPDDGAATCDSITAIEIDTGAGDDSISVKEVYGSDFTSLGSVTVHGGADRDNIVGTPGADDLFGDEGFDTFSLVVGDDRIDGGPDGDVVTITTRFDVVLTDARLETGDDRIAMTSVEEVHLASSGRALRFDGREFTGDLYMITDRGDDRLLGGKGIDIMTSGGGDDRLVGNAGNDKLLAQGGDDVVLGGPGTDFLDGSTGHDRCSGGPGLDRITNCE